MTEPAAPNDRRCPVCGARVAQRARTCIMCGADLDAAPRSLEVLTTRRSVPWLPIILVSAVLGIALGGLVLLASRGFGAPPPAGTPVSAASPSATGAVTATRVVSPTRTPVPTRETTPTRTPTDVPTPTIPPPINYTVQAGDTLSDLAERFDVSMEAIRQANGMDDDLIVAGEVLVIPRPTPVPTPAPGETVTATPPAVVTVNHTVQEGETLSEIALNYGVAVDVIQNANGITDPTAIKPGDVLVIPLGTPTPTASPTAGPTSTSTPRPQYEAPPLLSPPDKAAFVLEPNLAAGEFSASEGIVLQWASVGLLGMHPPDPANEWYQVTLLDTTAGGEPRRYYTRATSWRVSSELRNLVPVGSIHEFTWQVQVVRETGQEPDGTPRVVPNGRASRTRSFRWAGPAAATPAP